MKKHLTSKQKRYLRGFGHTLEPIVRVGKNLIDEALLNQLEKALDKHELVKVSVQPNVSEKRKEIFAELESKVKAQKVQSIGRMSLFFRQKEEESKFRLPAAE